MSRASSRTFVLRGQPGAGFIRPGRRALHSIRELERAALAAIAAKAPAESVARLVRQRAGAMMPGADLAVLHASPEAGLQVMEGPALDSARLAAIAERLESISATAGAAPIQLRGSCFGWLQRGPISASKDVVVMALLAADRSLNPRERRLLDVAVHLLQVAFAQQAICCRLEEINQRFEVALNSISQGVCFFDGSGRLVLANPRYAEIYSIAPGRIQPRMSLQDIFELRQAAGAAPRMTADQYLNWRTRVNSEDGLNRSVVELANGRVVEIHNQPMPDGGWVATHEDITARTSADEQIAHMARHDALTGLANRLLFHERLETALAGGSSYAVLVMDLDGFKPVNDTFGHPIGDKLLQAVAGRLRHCTRQTDTICRLGGDEFAILTATELPEQARDLANRIARAIGEPFHIGEINMCVGVSIGIAYSERHGDTPDALLKRSDVALYRAKADGRGRFCCFEPAMQEQLIGKLRLENELREAIAREEFEVFYQPLLDLQSGEVCAFEALLRWRHPVRGLVSPAEFIPIAEACGLIVPLGAWVLMQACADAADWPSEITVAVNLSAAQFKSRSLVCAVQEALDASGVAAARLELEVTETTLLENDAETLLTLQTLSALGVRLSMDDFGTGHSSLNYLRRFPFNKIKIDQSYIRDMSARSESLAIVRAILSLGRSLRLVTTAEGVETEAQLSSLREEGCDEVQGFLFSEPRPASEVPRMLLSGAGRAARPGANVISAAA